MLLSKQLYSLFRTANANPTFVWLRPKLLFKQFNTCPNLLASISFNLSDIGEGIREVVVKEWFVKVGDKVSQFDEICEVQSDKASVTITSRYDGVIKKLHYKVDETALVGKPLIEIETENGDEPNKDVPAQTNNINLDNAEKKPVRKLEEISDSDSETDGIQCIPSVRRLAKEYKVHLSKIKGTGRDGRITKEDVLNYLEMTSTEDVRGLPPKHLDADLKEVIKGYQKVMVKTMTESLKIPHLVYGDEISVTKLSEWRKALKGFTEMKELKISYMPFFIKAASNALHKYPIINSSVDESCEHVISKKFHNIGVAMDTSNGLVVPVIKNVDKLSIMDIHKELTRLVAVGKSGSFSTHDLSGGTFTLSNIGAIGGTYMKPVIMPPQVAIMTLGASKILPRFDESRNVVAEEIINISTAGDHRIIDGATMARFCQLFKKQIENPYLFFLNL